MSPFLGTRGAGTNKAFGFAGTAAPNQVTGLTATDFGTSRAYNNGRIDLSWTAPANNGATISGYLIQRSTDGSTYSTLVANTGSSSTTYSDTGLSSNQIYYYKVSAINAVGTGLASTAANATSTTVPQAPTVSATDVGTARAYNNGAATVTVSGGATGGKAISSYTATSSPGSFTATSGSPLTVTGLASATAYTFSVTATNANGTSTATVTNSITATTVPQAPTIGTAADGGTGTTATVTYTANATGGKAVSVYTATSSPGSITGTGSSPITVSGLTSGTAYTFTVTATNANGTSLASAASNSVTPAVPSSWYQIATAVPSGSSSEVIFSNIPQDYSHLRIHYVLYGGATPNITAALEFNDINSGYKWQNRYAYGGGTKDVAQSNTSNYANMTAIARGGNTAPLIGIIDIPEYSSTTKTKIWNGNVIAIQDSDAQTFTEIADGRWANTSAITKIRFFTIFNTYVNAGRITLYGMKGSA